MVNVIFCNTTPYKSPCYKCEDRHPLCHCACDKYLKYRSQVDKWHDDVESEKDFKKYNSDKIEKAKAKATKKRKHFRS